MICTGLDIYRDAIEKARRNAENAGCVVHYINRDYFDFTHSYLFDEIITDMPRSQGEEAKEESRKLYGRFFEKSLTHLKDGGMMVLYTMEPELAERRRPAGRSMNSWRNFFSTRKMIPGSWCSG